MRLDLIVEGQAFRLLLAHTSARQFLAYESMLKTRNLILDQTLHRLEVTHRGTWDEVRFFPAS